jgi:hypothetical protein
MVRALTKAGNPVALGVKTVTSGPQYTVISSDKILLIDDDTIAQQVTVLLPAVLNCNDRELTVKKIGTTAAVVVDGSGSETIDGATTQTISAQYDAMHIICDGTAWWIV